MSRRGAGLLLLGGVVALALALLLARDGDRPRAAAALAGPAPIERAVGATIAVRPEAAARPAAAVQSPELPPAYSQLGSDPDGGARLGADGALIPDQALRRYFDWHRAAIGELDEAAIRARLQAGLASQLPPAALAQAMALYERYLAYLDASDRLPFEADPLRRLDQLRALRQMLFGEVLAAALFGAEELAVEARLLRRQIADDRGLDEAKRAERLAAFDAALPAELRPAAESQRVAAAEELAAIYDAADVPAEERQREREALFGAAAADRLAALDDARADWQRRLAAFDDQRARLQQDPRLAATERDARLRRWVAEHFDPAERRRLQALLDAGLLDPAQWPDG